MSYIDSTLLANEHIVLKAAIQISPQPHWYLSSLFNIRILIAVIICSFLFLSGCSNTQGSSAKINRSGFDGAKSVSINGHSNACKTIICTGLGAQWTTNNPDYAVLVVYLFNEIKGIHGAQLSIDNKKYDLQIMNTMTDFNDLRAATKESRQLFAVRLDLIRQIINSRNVWLRIQTNSGYIENAVVDGDIDSKAYHALKRFITAVDQN